MKKKEVLLVEDNQQQGSVYADMLATANYEVYWESYADKAREVLSQKVAGIVILVVDLHIPKNEDTPADTAHGYDLVSDAKKILGKDFPIVIISEVKSRSKIMTEGKLSEFSQFEIVEKPVGSLLVEKVDEFTRGGM